jgi:DNA polymerase-1
MRLAMIRLDKRFDEQINQRTKMLLQIHDELIFETPKEDAKRISKVIIDEMSSVVKSDQHSFSIPLTVDLNTGDNWGALH